MSIGSLSTAIQTLVNRWFKPPNANHRPVFVPLSASTLRAALDHAPDVIAIFDRQFRHVYVNRAAERATGLPPESFPGKTNADLGMPPHLVEFWHSKLAETFNTAQEQAIEFEFPEGDAAGFYQSRLTPLLGEDGTVALVMVDSRNISDLVRATNEVKLTHAQLEERVRERTSELLAANEQLQNQIAHRQLAEARLSSVLENAIEGFVQTDMDGNYISINRAAAAIYGYDSPEAFLAERKNSVTQTYANPEDRKIFVQMIERDGIVRQLEQQVLKRDGSAIWINVSGRVVRDEDGNALLYETFFNDITHRRIAEERLRHSERLLREAQQIARIASYEWEVPGNRITWSDQIYEMTGLAAGEHSATYDAFLAIVHPDDRPGVEEAIARALSQKSDYDHVYRIRRPDGAELYFRDRGKVIVDGSGNALRLIGTTQDITKQREDEEVLRMQSRILENMVEGVVVTDRDGFIRYTNPAFDHMFGYGFGELVGQNVSLINAQSEDEFAAIVADVYRKLEQTGAWSGELRNRRRDGTKFISKLSLSQLDLDTEPLWITVQEDISDKKRIEEAERDQRNFATALHNSAIALSSVLQVDELLLRILYQVKQVVPHSLADIMLVEAGKIVGMRHYNSHDGNYVANPLPFQAFPVTDVPVLRQIAKSLEPLIIPNTQSYDGWHRNDDSIQSFLGVPLVSKGLLVGILTLHSRRTNFFTAAHLDRLRAFAPHASAAIENARLFEAVHSTSETLREVSRQLLKVQEDERQHLARELHDQIGQMLTELKHSIGVNNESARRVVDDLMQRIRRLSLDLRPTELDDLGLQAALQSLFSRYRENSNLQVDFRHKGLEGPRRFDPDIETAAFRIVQEALTNMTRYAGVFNAIVRVWATDELLSLQVEDQGKGFEVDKHDALAKTRGIAGMRERAKLLGGRFNVKSAIGEGTKISAEFPISPHRRP